MECLSLPLQIVLHMEQFVVHFVVSIQHFRSGWLKDLEVELFILTLLIYHSDRRYEQNWIQK